MPIRREGRSRFAQTHCDGQMRSKYPLSGPSDTSPSVRQQPIPAGPTRKKKPPIKRARVKKKNEDEEETHRDAWRPAMNSITKTKKNKKEKEKRPDRTRDHSSIRANQDLPVRPILSPSSATQRRKMAQ